MAGKRKPIDWAGIEADYRKTTTSIREIANWFRTDEAGIRRRAKREGWTRPVPEGEPKPSKAEIHVGKAVDKAVAVIAAGGEPLAPDLHKPAPKSASDLVDEAYATLRDVMANSPFPAPRVTAARAVINFAREENLAKGPGVGKKAQRQAGAEKAASEGRFAVPQPPPPRMQ